MLYTVLPAQKNPPHPKTRGAAKKAGDFMRVAGYPRVSTEEQKRHGVSIAAQEQALRDWARKHGHTYIGSYNDAGISARSRYTKRPELLRLLGDVQAGRVDLIIFTKLDRWFRNVGDYYEVQRILDRHGVAWKAIWEDYETETASGRLKVNIMLSVAQDEADRTSERIRQTNAYRWASGEVVQKLPAGYKRQEKTVIYDPERQAAVTAFFRTYLDTGSVARSMDAARLHGLHCTREGAAKMLSNPFYTGQVRGIAVPAYLTREEFETIQRRRAMYVRQPAQPNRTYLFSGLLVCAHCGARLSAQANRTTYYYVCGAHLNRRDGRCTLQTRGYANERKLEAWLLDHLDALLQGQIALSRVQGEQADSGPQREALLARLERIKLLFINGDIALEEYNRRKEETAAQLAALPQERPAVDLERLQSLLPDGWREVYRDLSREHRAAFWRRTVQRIAISPQHPPAVTFLA